VNISHFSFFTHSCCPELWALSFYCICYNPTALTGYNNPRQSDRRLTGCCFILLTRGWARLETRPKKLMLSTPVLIVCHGVLLCFIDPRVRNLRHEASSHPRVPINCSCSLTGVCISEKHFMYRSVQIFTILFQRFYAPGSDPPHKIMRYWFYSLTLLSHGHWLQACQNGQSKKCFVPCLYQRKSAGYPLHIFFIIHRVGRTEICVLLCFIDPRVRYEASSCPGIFSRTLRVYYVASSPGSPLFLSFLGPSPVFLSFLGFEDPT